LHKIHFILIKLIFGEGILTNISNESRQRISTCLGLAIVPLSGFATDVYIRSMPSTGAELKVTSLQVQLTLSVFLIRSGVAQLFIGAFLDSFGRRNRLSLIFAICSQ